MNLGFGFFPAFSIIFAIAFIVVLGIILSTAAKGFFQFVRNEDSPELTVRAKIAAKRTDVSRHSGNMHSHGSHMGHSHTRYYVTFEVESGDRMELTVDGGEYGLMAENDTGELTFQGTRFKGFERFK